MHILSESLCWKTCFSTCIEYLRILFLFQDIFSTFSKFKIGYEVLSNSILLQTHWLNYKIF